MRREVRSEPCKIDSDLRAALAAQPHVNAAIATIGPLMTQAEAEQLRAERAADRDDADDSAERERVARIHAQERLAVETGWVELDDPPSFRALVAKAVREELPHDMPAGLQKQTIERIADRVGAQLTSPIEGSPGWRAGIEASIRCLDAMERKPRDLWKPAYFAAIDEALVHLRAMLARGTNRSTTPVAAPHS